MNRSDDDPVLRRDAWASGLIVARVLNNYLPSISICLWILTVCAVASTVRGCLP